MLPALSEAATATPADEPELATVGRYPALDEAETHALVVLAMNEPCWILPAGGQFELAVESATAAAAAAELRAYDLDAGQSAGVPHAEGLRWVAGGGLELSLLWALLLIVVYLWQLGDPRLAWLGANSSDGTVARGEWWRPVTALFLHADAVHLAGNVVAGVCFFTLVMQALGRAAGMALVLGSGVAGNALNVWLRFPEPFRSLGASTAVFGALGILTGVGIVDAVAGRRRAAALWIPVIGGLTMLGWLGTGGPQVDFTAHFAGFGVGLVLGLAAAAWRVWRQQPAAHGVARA